MAVRTFAPLDSVLVVIVQPLPVTTALPTTAVLSRSVTTSPLVPVPVIVGVVSLVVLSPFTPVSLADASVTPAGFGVEVSMISESAADVGDTLPATSVWKDVSVWVPAASGALAVTAQAPPTATIADPIETPPSSTVTISPATPVPSNLGVVWLVMLSPEVPLSLPASSTGVDGIAGMVLSMVSPSDVDASETLPAASVSVAVSG